MTNFKKIFVSFSVICYWAFTIFYDLVYGKEFFNLFLAINLIFFIITIFFALIYNFLLSKGVEEFSKDYKGKDAILIKAIKDFDKIIKKDSNVFVRWAKAIASAMYVIVSIYFTARYSILIVFLIPVSYFFKSYIVKINKFLKKVLEVNNARN